MASEVITKALALIDGAPEQATASMQRDILAERPSELEAQRGIVARATQDEGIEAPRHSFLYASLLPPACRRG